MAVATRNRVLFTIVPVAALLAACAGGAATGNPYVAGVESRNEFVIHVENENFYDSRLYLHLDGVRRYLGAVGGKSQGVFTVPLTFSQELRVEIDILAGPTCMTDRIPVDPGDELRLQILPEELGADFCR